MEIIRGIIGLLIYGAIILTPFLFPVFFPQIMNFIRTLCIEVTTYGQDRYDNNGDYISR